MTSSRGEGADEWWWAVDALSAGRIVCIPTDTVYGLAVDPRVDGATRAVFELKGRPRALTLPVLVSRLEQAEGLAEGGLPALARCIAQRFWPGAVTLVVPRRKDNEWELGGDGATIGLRCPAHPLARELCERVGPLATTSANVHGEPPLTTADSVRERLARDIAFVFDGGTLDGPASTVVEISGRDVRCLREGAVLFKDLMDSIPSAEGSA